VIKIGDKLWTLNSRDRRQGWRCEVVVGETRVSWLTKREGQPDWPPPSKISKKTMQENHGKWGRERWYTEEGMRVAKFIGGCRNLIADRVRGEDDATKLKKIADILGMNIGEP
jgi:hypothetical protein